MPVGIDDLKSKIQQCILNTSYTLQNVLPNSKVDYLTLLFHFSIHVVLRIFQQTLEAFFYTCSNRNGAHYGFKDHYFCVDSNDGYSHLPADAKSQCSTYLAAGVFCSQTADAHYQPSASSRLHVYGPYNHQANVAFLFG